jgi:hypothetical protein
VRLPLTVHLQRGCSSHIHRSPTRRPQEQEGTENIFQVLSLTHGLLMGHGPDCCHLSSVDSLSAVILFSFFQQQRHSMNSEATRTEEKDWHLCVKKSNCKAVYVQPKLPLLLGLQNMMVAIGQCFSYSRVSVHGSVGRDGRDCCCSMR